MPDIAGSRILMIATHGFEQSELLVPRKELKAAGATVHVASPDGDPIRGWDEKEWGMTVKADCSIREASPARYDALVLPGGQMNPDVLRLDEGAVALVREFAAANKIIAAICHAPWLLIEAGLAAGRELTSYPSIKTDLKNAGATWLDRAVVVDDGIITSRSPADLPAFVAKVIEEIGEGRHLRKAG